MAYWLTRDLRNFERKASKQIVLWRGKPDYYCGRYSNALGSNAEAMSSWSCRRFFGKRKFWHCRGQLRPGQIVRVAVLMIVPWDQAKPLLRRGVRETITCDFKDRAK